MIKNRKAIQNSPTSSDFNLKNWLTLSVLSALCYLPFLINFMWGNHDWGWVKENTPLWSGVFEGRFSQFFLQTLLFDGQILPILTLLLSLIAYSGSAILLLNLWNVPHKNYIFLLLGLNLITAPYTISWLYFAFITLSCLSWGLCIIGGFWLLEKKSLKLALPSATILFTLALGGYPPVINLIFVIFFSLVLIDISLKNITPKSTLRKYIPHLATIALSLLSFLIVQYILKKLNLRYDTYNTAGISLEGLTEKIKLLSTVLFKQFITTTSFIFLTYKLSWALCTFLALIILFIKTPRRFANKTLFCLATLGLLLSPLTTLFLASNTEYVLYEPRIDFFGLTYIYIFSAAILLKSPRPIFKNLTYTLLTLLLFYNINTLAFAAKVWKLGFTAETNLMERILTRIENTPTFTPTKTYTFVQGGTLDFRSKYYPTNTPDSYTLTAPYIPWHLPSKAYKFYYPTDFFGADFDIFWRFVNVNQLYLTEDLTNYLKYNATPWPQPNAIYIDNNTIILTLTPEGKSQAQNWIYNQ